jgi:hypothetical protein
VSLCVFLCEYLEKFQDANDRIEVLEGLIKEAEEREKAEDELAIKKHSRRSCKKTRIQIIKK